MIFDKAVNRIRNETKISTISFDEPSEWLTGITSGTSQSGAMKLSAVNACVEVISNSISKLPSYVIERGTNERNFHPILKPLNERPNEAMAPSVYKKLMETYTLMNGNAYAVIIRNPTSKEPMELIPINPLYMAVNIGTDGKLWYYFTNPRTGEVTRLDNYDVLHYKAYSEDGIRGVSVLTRAQDVINTATAAQMYENKLYTQSARPSGVLKVAEPLEKEAKDRVREQWDSIYSGANNSFRTAVLDCGIEYQAISLSNKDTQFVESKEVSVVDIARFYGVPLYKINAGKQSYNSNEQNAIEYVASTLQPKVTQYEEEDTYKLLFDKERNRGLRIKRNIMVELRGDSASRGSWYKTMREIGAYSVNDIRALEDMPNVDGGETRNASLNYVPLEDFKKLSSNRNRGE